MRLNWKQRPSTVPTAPRMPGTSQASQGLDTSFRTTLTLGPLSAERGRYLVKSWEVRSARGSCWLLQADLLGRLRGFQGGPGGWPAGLRPPPQGSTPPSRKFSSDPAPPPCMRSLEAETSAISLDPRAQGIPAPSPAGRGAVGRVVGGESRRSAPSQGSLHPDPGPHPHISGLTPKTDS